MSAEIELKLSLDPAALKAFRASPLLAAARRRRQRVFNVYFDTPDCELARSRMALRLRKMGPRWLQTLKTAGSGAGGLSRRGEWEFVLPDATLDLALLRDTPLAGLADADSLHERLKPAFTTDFVRTTWLVSPAPGQDIEVALDVGEARCEDRITPLCEVELELKVGEAAHVIALGRALALSMPPSQPLMPTQASKAERGYRLFRGERLAAVKARPVKLDADWAPPRALQAIVAAGLEHFLANTEGAATTDDPEFIHQLRVALRRVRSVLRMFKVSAQAEELKWLAATLGAARDWDVFLADVWPPLCAAYVAAGGEARDAEPVVMNAIAAQATARVEARAALRSRRTALLVLALAELAVASEPPAVGANAYVEGADALLEPLPAFASRQIKRRHKRLLREAQGLAVMTAEARHQVRIEAKKLRYAVDFFAGLYRRERTEPYLAALAAIQEVLGEANDAATALTLLARLSPPTPLRLFAQGWFAARAHAHASEVDRLFEQLASVRRFWRGEG
ncbi:MAG: CHAD domain-containing protein [Betaproteobacteria bacterium]|nr:CHAD domain-containing protein [Betaproteobacteria bacterium]